MAERRKKIEEKKKGGIGIEGGEDRKRGKRREKVIDVNLISTDIED